MAECSGSLTPPPDGYATWLGTLTDRIHQPQQRATRGVNQELGRLSWQIGRDVELLEDH